MLVELPDHLLGVPGAEPLVHAEGSPLAGRAVALTMTTTTTGYPVEGDTVRHDFLDSPVLSRSLTVRTFHRELPAPRHPNHQRAICERPPRRSPLYHVFRCLPAPMR